MHVISTTAHAICIFAFGGRSSAHAVSTSRLCMSGLYAKRLCVCHEHNCAYRQQYSKCHICLCAFVFIISRAVQYYCACRQNFCACRLHYYDCGPNFCARRAFASTTSYGTTTVAQVVSSTAHAFSINAQSLSTNAHSPEGICTLTSELRMSTSLSHYHYSVSRQYDWVP